MSSELDQIKAKIAETERDMKQAMIVNDRDMILMYGKILAEQQHKENLLIAESSGNVIIA